MAQFPTSQQNLVISLMYQWLGESRINRTWDDYVKIAHRVPKIEALWVYVNQRLREFKESGEPQGSICYFKKGDQYVRYVPFPESVSKETVRRALKASGLLELRELYPVTN